MIQFFMINEDIHILIKTKIYSVLYNGQGGPIPHNMARPLMVRQPYSVAVPSTGGRLHPLVPEEREAW